MWHIHEAWRFHVQLYYLDKRVYPNVKFLVSYDVKTSRDLACFWRTIYPPGFIAIASISFNILEVTEESTIRPAHIAFVDIGVPYLD